MTAIDRHPWLVAVITISGLSAWMGLGTLHDFQHADSLLSVLVSTQRWTPFFWGQDRFGMLVPLVAMPIHDPLANMLLQGWIATSAALLAPFVIVRFLNGRSGDWIAIGACTDVLFLLVTPLVVHFDWLVAQPYGMSICLGFAALIVGDENGGARRSVSVLATLVLLTLAAWINISVVVMLAIATFVKSSKRIHLLALETIAAGFVVLLTKYGATAHTVSSLAPPRLWVDGWKQLFENAAATMTISTAMAGAVSAAALIAAVWLWRTGTLGWSLPTAILAMAVGNWLFVGTSLWVGMNRYSPRYMYPTLMTLGISVSVVFAGLFAKRKRESSLMALAALALVVIVRYGAPSIGRVEHRFDDRFGAQTAAMLQNGATVIAGDYWRVWPAVFNANLVLSRAHSRARVFGLAYRSEETDPLWKTPGRQVLIAAAPGDESVAAVAAEHGITVTLLKHLPTIDLYTAQP